MQIKKVSAVSIVALLFTGIVWLFIFHAHMTEHWQQTLQHARYFLLAWRLLLYSALIVIWCVLSPRLQQKMPERYFRLKQAAFWSFTLLLISEISNLLNWGMA